MNAKDTIETLLKLGVHMNDAFRKYELGTGKGWLDFMSSDEAKSAEGDVSELIERLTLKDIEDAVAEVQAREDSFLGGRKIADLSVDELTQFQALADTEHALVLREIKQIGTLKFWQWLVDDVLPTLLTVAKIALPLLSI
jgi:hypothetical protein